MTKFEIIMAGVAFFAIILKFIAIPGSGLLLTLSLMILAFYYYFSFAILNNIKLRDIFKASAFNYTNSKRIIGAIALGLSFTATLIGMLFKLQLWTGDNVQIEAGLFSMAIVFVIAYFAFRKSRDDFYIPLFKRIAVIGGFGLFLWLFPSDALIDIYYRDHQEFAELMKQSMTDPGNDELRHQLDSMKKEINNDDQ